MFNGQVHDLPGALVSIIATHYDIALHYRSEILRRSPKARYVTVRLISRHGGRPSNGLFKK